MASWTSTTVPCPDASRPARRVVSRLDASDCLRSWTCRVCGTSVGERAFLAPGPSTGPSPTSATARGALRPGPVRGATFTWRVPVGRAGAEGPRSRDQRPCRPRSTGAPWWGPCHRGGCHAGVIDLSHEECAAPAARRRRGPDRALLAERTAHHPGQLRGHRRRGDRAHLAVQRARHPRSRHHAGVRGGLVRPRPAARLERGRTRPRRGRDRRRRRSSTSATTREPRPWAVGRPQPLPATALVRADRSPDRRRVGPSVASMPVRRS